MGVHNGVTVTCVTICVHEEGCTPGPSFKVGLELRDLAGPSGVSLAVRPAVGGVAPASSD